MHYGNPIRVQEVKAAGDAWEVSGYVSTFTNVDAGSDVVLRGAFDDTIAAFNAGQKHVPLLRQHNGELVIGHALALSADENGLFSRFSLSKTALGEETRTLLQNGDLTSFSMGYAAAEVGFDGDVRQLKRVDLLESSVVAVPMNALALVTGVKALEGLPIAEILQHATETLSYAVAEAKALFDRRASEGRKPTDAYLEALEALLVPAEAALALKALLLSDPEAKAPDLDDTDPLASIRLRLALRRLGRLAGVAA